MVALQRQRSRQPGAHEGRRARKPEPAGREPESHPVADLPKFKPPLFNLEVNEGGKRRTARVEWEPDDGKNNLTIKLEVLEALQTEAKFIRMDTRCWPCLDPEHDSISVLLRIDSPSKTKCVSGKLAWVSIRFCCCDECEDETSTDEYLRLGDLLELKRRGEKLFKAHPKRP